MKTKTITGIAALTFLLSMPMMAASQADGGTVFKSKCVACHGADAAGQTAMGKSMKLRDLRSPEVQKQTDVELTKIISGGKGKMPAYGKQLSTPQVENLIAYIRTLKK